MFAEGNGVKGPRCLQYALTIAERHGDTISKYVCSAVRSYVFKPLVRWLEASRSRTSRRMRLQGKTKSGRCGPCRLRCCGSGVLSSGEHHRPQNNPPVMRHLIFLGSASLMTGNASQHLFDLAEPGAFSLLVHTGYRQSRSERVRYAAMAVDEAEQSNRACRALVMTMPIYFWID